MPSILTSTAVSSSVILAGALIPPATPADGATTTREFWGALAEGDLKAAQTFYAPKVTLKAGSELLKSRWALDPKADRKQHLTLERDELLTGYEKLIGGAGREWWNAVFGRIAAEQITTVAAEELDKPFTGVRPNDTVLKVAAGPGDDRMVFVLRPDQNGRWQVVAEATDSQTSLDKECGHVVPVKAVLASQKTVAAATSQRATL